MPLFRAKIVEVLEIGAISRTERSPLGLIAAVPTTVRLKNGMKAEQQMVVQFRQFAGKSFCVVDGSYGLPREIDSCLLRRGKHLEPPAGRLAAFLLAP
jgi:hypothetical protein